MGKLSVAILGTSGSVGPVVIESFKDAIFADKFQFPIKIVSRGKSEQGEKFTQVKGQLTQEGLDDLVSELSGVDVIIELTPPEPQLFALTEKLADAVKPKLFISSQFGCEVKKIDYMPNLLIGKEEHSDRIRSKGISVVDIYTGFFAIPGSFLHEIVQHVGIFADKGEIVYIDDPNKEFSYTTGKDLGNSVVAVASLAGTSLPQAIRIQSGKTTPKHVKEIYEREHNVTLKTRTITKEQKLADMKKTFEAGFQMSDFFEYLNTIYGQGLGKGVNFEDDENEIINPGESLWKWGSY